MDSCLAFPVFNQGDDPIACLNKEMDFLTVVASSSYQYVLQGLPPDVYAIMNHHKVAKEIWDRVKLLMQGLAVYVFNQGDDPITYLNKAMAFLTVVASSRFPSTNNQLRTSSNPRNHATIQDGRGQERVVKYYNCQGEGHMARQCTQPKRPRNAAWFKEKAMLAEAHEAGQILDEEQLAFLTDPGISDVLMANLSNYGSDVISEVPHFEPYHTDMDNQSVHAMQGFEQTLVANFTDNEITSDSNIIPQHVASPVIDDEETLILEELQTSHPNTDQSTSSPVQIEAPKELPKITPDAITEGEWGFEHTKTIFLNEIIPFLKTLKDIFNVFDKDLLNEVESSQNIDTKQSVTGFYMIEGSNMYRADSDST
ncbi:integrase, catalytic region, zinc finger, CCHC-type containing protein [Tanacetum coccineum]